MHVGVSGNASAARGGYNPPLRALNRAVWASLQSGFIINLLAPKNIKGHVNIGWFSLKERVPNKLCPGIKMMKGDYCQFKQRYILYCLRCCSAHKTSHVHVEKKLREVLRA
jgi:hypothetical protein